MINHMRTLFLNQHFMTASGALGAEYVDTGFRPLALPQPLQEVQHTLLPTGSTAYQVNGLLAYYMRLLHAPDLEPYTLRFDARYTYALTDDYTEQRRVAPIVTAAAHDNACDVTLLTDYQNTERWQEAASVVKWDLQHTPDDGQTVVVARTGRVPTALPVVFVGNVSRPLTLVPDRLAVRFRSPSATLTGTFRYGVTLYMPVHLDIQQLFEKFEQLDARIGASAILFDPWGTYSEDLTLLRTLWEESVEAPLRVGAFLLGYGYQCERLRQGLSLSILQRASTLTRIT